MSGPNVSLIIIDTEVSLIISGPNVSLIIIDPEVSLIDERIMRSGPVGNQTEKKIFLFNQVGLAYFGLVMMLKKKAAIKKWLPFDFLFFLFFIF